MKALLLKPAALAAAIGLALIGAGMIFGSFAIARGAVTTTGGAVCGSPPTTSATAPTAPLSLVASAGVGSTALSWSAPASDGGSPITGYDVYRGTTPGGESATPIAANVSGTSFNDTGLTNGTTYYYTVAAVNAFGVSPQSAETPATPQAVAPSAPTGLVATAGNGQVTLSWAAPASDGGSPIASYSISRGTSTGGEAALTTIASGRTTYTDTGLTNTTQYFYTVAAVNAVGTSPASGEASATPDVTATAAPAAAPAATTATTTSGSGATTQSAAAPATAAAQLCIEVQTYPSATATVTPGGTASFIVWVWSITANATNVLVSANVSAASYLGTPSFTTCPPNGTTCSIASLPVGLAASGLLVSVPVSTAAPDAASISFTAQVSAAGGAVPNSAATTEVVAATSNATLPSSDNAVPPLISLPPIPGTSTSPINPSDLFPVVSPSAGTGNLGLPGARSGQGVHVAEVSSTVPIDDRLIGAQLVGLAVLAGAVTIAIMRLSLRRRLPTPAPAAGPSAAAPAVPAPAPPADSSKD